MSDGDNGGFMDRYLFTISIIALLLGGAMMLLSVWALSSGLCLS